MLLLTDPIDEFVVAVAARVQGQDAQGRSTAATPTTTADEAADEGEVQARCWTHLKAKLPEVQDVRLSTRLKESAACLVADEAAMTAHMERLMQRMGRGDECRRRSGSWS